MTPFYRGDSPERCLFLLLIRYGRILKKNVEVYKDVYVYIKMEGMEA